ncbi:DUF1045 domain-containing protein [Cocleimonas sp. KMM 6892]|uniref:DUF1045 domain-containing protein n=1 Tax=unclassified Cocleimonas TaxID=2639732 RepID=UPI002DB64454|nr:MULTISPECIES: DUF1045 domain-containing protein [unclassified Cocleimonas]MEB8433397.1 DUF1045 domain-containing protein [Cocleimonas sp. KMM 6892]MEC4716208.1 DUF1045 domain-containing protein [Cocleimonas sp. KMM 6895]MEC4745899.1 DUF1045 domain-containing protein [Cocleimonas sp. KMM 6896]
MNNPSSSTQIPESDIQSQERYAIYFTLPTDHPVYRLATLWLGYDVCTGRHIEDFEKTVYHRDLDELAKFSTNPKKYGFHATLKAPFRLQSGKNIEELESALDEFSKNYNPFKCKPLKIKKMDKLLALTPIKPCKKLTALASDCVTTFEDFRAPNTEIERARRDPDNLTPHQTELLDKWGYPFVMDEFNFHMTLSNQLKKKDIKIVRKCLKQLFRSFLGKPFHVDQICLFHQTNYHEPFKLVRRYPLVG